MTSVVMMAKRPVAGRVKTRLGQSIGHATAAAISQKWIAHLIDVLGSSGQRRVVAASPDDECDLMKTQISGNKGQAWTWRGQGSGDLGLRMKNQFWQEMSPEEPDSPHFDRPGSKAGMTKVVMIGSDLPDVSPADLERAWNLLDTSDVVLGPATDGGYWMIGLSGPWDERYENLFDRLPWSTPELFDETIARVKKHDLQFERLDVREDIDDLEALQRWLATSGDTNLGRSVQKILETSIS